MSALKHERNKRERKGFPSRPRTWPWPPYLKVDTVQSCSNVNLEGKLKLTMLEITFVILEGMRTKSFITHFSMAILHNGLHTRTQMRNFVKHCTLHVFSHYFINSKDTIINPLRIFFFRHASIWRKLFCQLTNYTIDFFFVFKTPKKKVYFNHVNITSTIKLSLKARLCLTLWRDSIWK